MLQESVSHRRIVKRLAIETKDTTIVPLSASNNPLDRTPMSQPATPESFPEVREAVRALCSQFSGEYWRGIDEARAYPEEFVKALTDAGWLAALIPEEYGGSG